MKRKDYSENYRNVMLLVPHQDDEIILCGSFLKGLVDEKYHIFVVFMTNGDYDEHIGEVRLRESLAVMDLYDIPEDHVIFMGYANQYAPEFSHIYNARPGETVRSRFGNSVTYGLPDHPEYCYQRFGKHHPYRREYLISDLTHIILEIRPHLIFTTDVEMHVDHIANSLFLDEAMGILLRKMPGFRPVIYKKQGYSTDWYAAEDYAPINNAASRPGKGYAYVNYQICPFMNPYIRWQDRVRIPVDKSARIDVQEGNIVFQALRLYASQNAEGYFYSLLNSDSVFWRRRTDSITYSSEVKVSSGEAAYLNDFKILDCGNIAHTNKWCLNASVWHPMPDDRKPVITFELDNETIVSEVVIYQEFCPGSAILQSRFVFDGSDELRIGPLEQRKPTVIQFSPRRARKIEYIIEHCSDDRIPPGITEIEIYEKQHHQLSRIKLMIDDNFVYDYFTDGKLKEKIGIYRFFQDGSADVALDLDEFEITLSDGNGCFLRGNRMQGIMSGNNLILHAASRTDKGISDEVIFQRISKERLPDPIMPDVRNELLLKWIALKQDHIDFGRYLEAHAYHMVAVYGLGDWGIRTIRELQESGAEIKYVVDKYAGQQASSYPLYTPDESLEEVDVMVVTVVHRFAEIEEQMSQKVRCPIISVADMINSLA